MSTDVALLIGVALLVVSICFFYLKRRGEKRWDRKTPRTFDFTDLR